MLTWNQYLQLYREGNWQTAVGSKSGVPALQPFCSQRYPHNSTTIPDQIRAEEFLRELAEHEKANGRKPLDLSSFRQLPDLGPFPAGAHRVTCCAPNVATTVLPPPGPRRS